MEEKTVDAKADEKPDAKSDTKSDLEPMDPDPPFTLKIINLEGTHFYELESKNLGAANEVTDENMRALVAAKVPMAHVPYDKGHFRAFVCGTFFVNLSKFKK
jgi:hypothetical protein